MVTWTNENASAVQHQSSHHQHLTWKEELQWNRSRSRRLKQAWNEYLTSSCCSSQEEISSSELSSELSLSDREGPFLGEHEGDRSAASSWTLLCCFAFAGSSGDSGRRLHGGTSTMSSSKRLFAGDISLVTFSGRGGVSLSEVKPSGGLKLASGSSTTGDMFCSLKFSSTPGSKLLFTTGDCQPKRRERERDRQRERERERVSEWVNEWGRRGERVRVSVRMREKGRERERRERERERERELTLCVKTFWTSRQFFKINQITFQRHIIIERNKTSKEEVGRKMNRS